MYSKQKCVRLFTKPKKLVDYEIHNTKPIALA